MRANGDVHEYLISYVNNFPFPVKEHKLFLKNLQDKYDFSVKETGPIDHHLGANFTRDEDGTLCMSPKKYITERLFGTSACLDAVPRPMCNHH